MSNVPMKILQITPASHFAAFAQDEVTKPEDIIFVPLAAWALASSEDGARQNVVGLTAHGQTNLFIPTDKLNFLGYVAHVVPLEMRFEFFQDALEQWGVRKEAFAKANQFAAGAVANQQANQPTDIEATQA